MNLAQLAMTAMVAVAPVGASAAEINFFCDTPVGKAEVRSNNIVLQGQSYAGSWQVPDAGTQSITWIDDRGHRHQITITMDGQLVCIFSSNVEREDQS